MAKAKTTAKKTMKTTLWKREQGWDKLSATELRKLEKFCREYMAFLSAAKTERLAHDLCLELAQKDGFRDLADVLQSGDSLKPGDKVYRSWREKTLVLMEIGSEPLESGLSMVGAHIDAPRLDAKSIHQDDSLALLDTHYYGGIKKYQWWLFPWRCMAWSFAAMASRS